jgi:hypothetical protein
MIASTAVMLNQIHVVPLLKKMEPRFRHRYDLGSISLDIDTYDNNMLKKLEKVSAGLINYSPCIWALYMYKYQEKRFQHAAARCSTEMCPGGRISAACGKQGSSSVVVFAVGIPSLVANARRFLGLAGAK